MNKYKSAIEQSRKTTETVHMYGEANLEHALNAVHTNGWPNVIHHACTRDPKDFDKILSVEVMGRYNHNSAEQPAWSVVIHAR